mmetsp:Transcript_77291/g.250180  ORF Transcript_77291/g.250180 Transcript_77291/m.250180 type:complete len:656 (-) Transcript_77291:1901-3868(-)
MAALAPVLLLALGPVRGQDVAAICKEVDVAQAPWCNASLPFRDRARAIVRNLTDEEKSGLFNSGAAPIPRIRWPGYNWWMEALHGVARQGLATSWPQVIGVGATFDEELWWQLGNMTSTEGRGKAGGVGHTYWAPVVNIFRDPRWGRGQESPGEDPVLTSKFGAMYISGLQGDHPKYLKVSACLKHFSAYSQETDREGMGAVVTAQDMNDTYLPAFMAGIQQGRASGIMCSYNGETYGYGLLGNGTQGGAIPSCANRYTMTDLARDSWGFRGYIVSDCYAVNRVLDRHHYANNLTEVLNATLGAGMDLECGNILVASNMLDFYKISAPAARASLDASLERLFEVQLRLGWADPPAAVPWSDYGEEVVDTAEHRALAKTAADRSLVLLKNEGSVLPFVERRVRTVAMIGPHANATAAMQGNYAGTAPFLIPPCEGVAQHAAVLCVAPVTCTVASGSGPDCWDDAARTAVADADAVVLALGLDAATQEFEGHDRADLLLPVGQRQLLASASAAARAHGKPLVVVLLSGSAVDLGPDGQEVDAVLWCGYPGQAGGLSIGDALFGATNAFGRLPMTWYDNSFTKAVRLDDYAMRPNASRDYPGRTHRFYTGNPLYRFGHGLRYTSFDRSLVLDATADLGAGAGAGAEVGGGVEHEGAVE